MYEGEYIADKKHGRGVYRWCSGASFTGQFEYDMKEGVGTYVSSNGEKFEVRVVQKSVSTLNWFNFFMSSPCVVKSSFIALK